MFRHRWALSRHSVFVRGIVVFVYNPVCLCSITQTSSNFNASYEYLCFDTSDDINIFNDMCNLGSFLQLAVTYFFNICSKYNIARQRDVTVECSTNNKYSVCRLLCSTRIYFVLLGDCLIGQIYYDTCIVLKAKVAY